MNSHSATALLLCFVVGICAEMEPTGWRARGNTDDLVDPSGWNYDRSTKSAKNYRTTDKLIDPDGWNYDRRTKDVKRTTLEDVAAISCYNFLDICQEEVKEHCKIPHKCEEPPTCNTEMRFMKRFINLLLKSAHLSSYSVAQGGPTSGLVDIRVTTEDLRLLEWFGDPTRTVSWQQLDTVMTRVINSGLHMSKEYFTLMDNIFYFLSLREVWLWAGAFSMTMFVLWLLLNGHPFSGTCILMSVIIFMFSYVMEFYHMYKEAEIEQFTILKQHSEIPLSCRPGDMTWYQVLLDSFTSMYKFKTDECQKYYSALMVDPMIKVSPTRVLSNIMADLCLSPARKIGEAIAAYSTGVMANLPGMYGWLVLLISSVGVFIVVLTVILRILGSRIRLHSFIFGIEIGSDTPQIQSSSTPTPPPVAEGPSHPLLEAFNKSSGSNLVIMDTASLKELMTPSPTQNNTENPLNVNLVQHRNLVENICPPEHNSESVEVAETSKSALCVQSINHPVSEDEGKKQNVNQQPRDGSGDASSCISEPETS